MSDDAAFWMVWSPTGRPATVRHGSPAAANAEAERLARLDPRSEFYVLRAERRVKAVAVVSVELGDIPF